MIDPSKTLSAARRLELVMTAGIALLLASGMAGLLVAAAAPVDVAQAIARQGGYEETTLSLWQAWALIGVIALHVIVWTALLVVARELFRQLAHGNPGAAVPHARRVAIILWAMLLWGVISQVITSGAATWGYPEGERALSIAIGTPQITVVLAALVASFLAHAFALGAELWQDHQQVI